jgi:hypothetical protein
VNTESDEGSSIEVSQEQELPPEQEQRRVDDYQRRLLARINRAERPSIIPPKKGTPGSVIPLGRGRLR